MAIFIDWIIFIALEKKKKLESHKKMRENKFSSNVIMPSEDTKILEFNQNQKQEISSNQ